MTIGLKKGSEDLTSIPFLPMTNFLQLKWYKVMKHNTIKSDTKTRLNKTISKYSIVKIKKRSIPNEELISFNSVFLNPLSKNSSIIFFTKTYLLT